MTDPRPPALDHAHHTAPTATATAYGIGASAPSTFPKLGIALPAAFQPWRRRKSDSNKTPPAIEVARKKTGSPTSPVHAAVAVISFTSPPPSHPRANARRPKANIRSGASACDHHTKPGVSRPCAAAITAITMEMVLGTSKATTSVAAAASSAVNAIIAGITVTRGVNARPSRRLDGQAALHRRDLPMPCGRTRG